MKERDKAYEKMLRTQSDAVLKYLERGLKSK